MFNKKGQSILEYVIVLTAVVTVLIWAAATIIKPAVETGFNDTARGIENVSTRLANVSK